MGTIPEEGLSAEDFARYSIRRGPSRHVKSLCGMVSGGPALRALEVGSGAGVACGHMASRLVASAIVGCDADETLVAISRRRRKGEHENKIFFVCNPPSALPFISESFDVVFSESALHHFDSPEIMVREMWRVLRPGGLLLIVDINPRALAAVIYRAWVAVRASLKLASAPEIALMKSIENARDQRRVGGYFDKSAIPYRLSKSGIGLYFEARKRAEGGK